jgi:hypothetical protein
MKLSIRGGLGALIEIRSIKNVIIEDMPFTVAIVSARSGSVTYKSKDEVILDGIETFKEAVKTMHRTLKGSAKLNINGKYQDYLQLFMKATGRVTVELVITEIRDNDLDNKAFLRFETDQSYLPMIFS